MELTDKQIEEGWHKTFSTSNPYCPCNLKSFTKAVRWAEHALAAAPAPASPAALTVPEKITVSMAPTSEYAIGWNDCVDAILAALMEWRIKVAGPAGHERFETFKGETLDSACDAARGQGFYVVEDEDGRPVEEMNSWRK